MKRRPILLTVAIMLIAAMMMPGVAVAKPRPTPTATPIPTQTPAIPPTATSIPTQAPAIPALDEPANGATDQPVNVSLRWHDPSWSGDPKTNRVQVSQNSTFTSLILDQDITSTVWGYWGISNLTKNAVYYWRVNASANGQTSPWSPVWSFQITNKEIPAVPVLVSPENGATGLTESPTLVWNAVEGADSYDIQYTVNPSFLGSYRIVYSWTGTSIHPRFGNYDDYENTFYWRVRARNVAGTSAWSTVWSFTCVIQGCD